MATIPVHVFARWKAKAGYLETILALLRQVRTKSLQEEGNLFYQVHRSKADADTLIIFEGYTDEVAQQTHTQSEHFKEVIIGQIVPLLEEREVTLATPIAD